MINVSLWKYIREDLKGIEGRLAENSELEVCQYLVSLAVEEIDQHLYAVEAMEKQSVKESRKQPAG